MSTEGPAQRFEIHTPSQSEKCRPEALSIDRKATFSTLGTAMSYDWNRNIRGFNITVIDEAAYTCEMATSAVLGWILHSVGEPMLGTSEVFVGNEAQFPPYNDKTFPFWMRH